VSNPTAAYDLAPLAGIALIGALLAIVPVLWVAWRHRASGPAERPGARLRALTVLTLCLTFDLVLFGAFTRLTDSGLGCPDWPGCYASASPQGAHAQIQAAQHALPDGPVTHHKAWIEMIHRYLATGVGALIVVLAAMNWRRPHRTAAAPWWAAATLVWVCLQGAFGALTVTMKLYPAVVTAHLLGGLVLLVLLAVQTQLQRRAPLVLPPALYRGAIVVAALSALQIALGGWVSTNYAVLACSDFPTCQGSWWPAMDFEHGFALLRELGAGKDGGALPFAALTAIHYMHRMGAYAVLAAMAGFAWRLHASGDPALRPWAIGSAAIALWQLASGLSNVVLGWPLLGAVAHTGGAAAWVTLLALLVTRAALARPARAQSGAPARTWQPAP
jgi:cytochrome c oxidase assembly protein subunit 15